MAVGSLLAKASNRADTLPRGKPSAAGTYRWSARPHGATTADFGQTFSISQTMKIRRVHSRQDDGAAPATSNPSAGLTRFDDVPHPMEARCYLIR